MRLLSHACAIALIACVAGLSFGGWMWIQPPPPEVLFPQTPAEDVIVCFSAGNSIYRATSWGGSFSNVQTLATSPRNYCSVQIYGATNSWYVDQQGNGPWISTNAGVSWVSRTVGANCNIMACGGAYGQIVLVGRGSGYPMLSTNWGQSWSTLTSLPSAAWRGAFVSTNGAVLALCGDSQNIWLSWDTGNTWVSRSPPAGSPSYHRQLYCSQNGTNIFLGHYNGYCYMSYDAGQTWTQIADMPSGWYYEFGAWGSADFKHIYSLQYANNPNATLWHSENAGTNWTATSWSGDGQFYMISCTPDGKYVVIRTCDGNKYLIGSKDYGATLEVIEATTRDRSGVFVWSGRLQ